MSAPITASDEPDPLNPYGFRSPYLQNADSDRNTTFQFCSQDPTLLHGVEAPQCDYTLEASIAHLTPTNVSAIRSPSYQPLLHAELKNPSTTHNEPLKFLASAPGSSGASLIPQNNPSHTNAASPSTFHSYAMPRPQWLPYSSAGSASNPPTFPIPVISTTPVNHSFAVPESVPLQSSYSTPIHSSHSTVNHYSLLRSDVEYTPSKIPSPSTKKEHHPLTLNALPTIYHPLLLYTPIKPKSIRTPGSSASLDVNSTPCPLPKKLSSLSSISRQYSSNILPRSSSIASSLALQISITQPTQSMDNDTSHADEGLKNKPRTNEITCTQTASVSATPKSKGQTVITGAIQRDLNTIWNTKPGVPTVESRRAWAAARGIPSDKLSSWFCRRRARAKACGSVWEDDYHLDVHAPDPVEDDLGIQVKREACEQTRPHLTDSGIPITLPCHAIPRIATRGRPRKESTMAPQTATKGLAVDPKAPGTEKRKNASKPVTGSRRRTKNEKSVLEVTPEPSSPSLPIPRTENAQDNVTKPSTSTSIVDSKPVDKHSSTPTTLLTDCAHPPITPQTDYEPVEITFAQDCSNSYVHLSSELLLSRWNAETLLDRLEPITINPKTAEEHLSDIIFPAFYDETLQRCWDELMLSSQQLEAMEGFGRDIAVENI